MNAKQLGRYRYNMANGYRYHKAVTQALEAKNPDVEHCIRNQIYSAGYYMTARAIRESHLGPFASSKLRRDGVIEA